jgi:hypothetical protein
VLSDKRLEEIRKMRKWTKVLADHKDWAKVYYQDVGYLLKAVEIMPKAAERALRAKARKKWPGDKKRQDRYVFGGMRHKLGWRPSTQKKSK